MSWRYEIDKDTILRAVYGWAIGRPDYGQLVPAPLVVYSTRARLPMRIATLLYPLESAGAPAPLNGLLAI